MAKKTPEINSSSTADMAFLLLCFFMMTTTMDQDKGLQRQLPPMPDKTQETEIKDINRRNIIVVKINAADKLLAGTEPIHVSQLKDKIKEFLTNPNDDVNLPERKVKPVKAVEMEEDMYGVLAPKDSMTMDYPVSSGLISLQNDRGTSYKEYIAVQNELVKAINELREACAQEYFHKSFSNCTNLEQIWIRKAIPQNISEAEPKDISKK